MPPQLGKRPAPGSDALPTTSECRSQLERFAMKHRCREISRAQDVYNFLSGIGAYDELPLFFGPCTKSDSQPCQLLDQLDAWNRFLQEVDMRMGEVSPETLRVVPRRRASVDSTTKYCAAEGWILLQWLFKQHSCIAELHLLNPFRCRHLHLSDTLCQNSGLKTLTLRYETGKDELKTIAEEELEIIVSTISDWTVLEKLSISGQTLSEGTVVQLEACLKKLPSLRFLEISFSSIQPSCNTELLKDAFKRISALTPLSLSYADPEIPDVELVLECLSPGLSELNVSDCLLKPREGAFFQEFLASNSALERLYLYQKDCTGMGELNNVFRGLLLNQGLEELHLLGFGLEYPTLELLAEAVADHSTLKILEVDSFDEKRQVDGTPLAKMLGRNKSLQELIFRYDKVGCYSAFGEAVRTNTTLKSLTLNLVQLDDLAEICVYRGFLEALSCNDTIKQVTLEGIYSVLVSEFSQLLRETGTERRVTFEVDMCDAEMFTEALEKCTGLPQLRYVDWDAKAPIPEGALQHLLHYNRLEDLDLALSKQLIEGNAVTSLVRLLVSTRTLKSLDLFFFTSPASTHALLEGISRNRSISYLSIHEWTFDAHNAEQLWQILRNNNRLNSLYLSLGSDSDLQVFSQFHERLLDNHSLLSVDFVDECLDLDVKITEVMRRNQATLYRAVMFVMGSRGRRYVEAFERVSGSPALVHELQKSASESEEDVKERVKRTKDYLDHYFLAAVGVVKDSVVCTENGQLQLDRIGLDNWLHIRQYLKVADIKEPADEPSSDLQKEVRSM